jgi:hypothetical protein
MFANGAGFSRAVLIGARLFQNIATTKPASKSNVGFRAGSCRSAPATTID